MKTFFRLVWVYGWIASVGFAEGQTLSIDWHTVGSAGNVATGAVFALRGTLSEPGAPRAPLIGGTYSLNGGIWSIFAAQTPGAPMLSIQRENGAVRISWPISPMTYVLEQSSSASGPWSGASLPYATNETRIAVTPAISAGNKYFRLRKEAP